MNVVNLIIFLILVVGGILLQIFLSSRENKWLGLILPGLTFLYSLLIVLNIGTFSYLEPNGSVSAGIIFPIIVTFLIGNIPTFVLLGIYMACREKFKKEKEIDKMNIQDL